MTQSNGFFNSESDTGDIDEHTLAAQIDNQFLNKVKELQSVQGTMNVNEIENTFVASIVDLNKDLALADDDYNIQPPNPDMIGKEQANGAVLSEVRTRIEKGENPERSVALRHSKGLMAYYNRFESLAIESVTNLVVYKEPNHMSSDFEQENLFARSLFLIVSALAHSLPSAGHMGVEKTPLTLKGYFYWPGLQKWVQALVNDCLICQKNKHKPSQNQARLENWNDDIPFPMHTVHIIHKGPLNPSSKEKKHCLLVVDARFIQVYAVKSTSASDNIKALEKFTTSF